MSQPRKPEHANKTEDMGNGYSLERRLQGYAYAKNGNLGNATPRYSWIVRLDGKLVDSARHRRQLLDSIKADAYRD